MRLIDLDPDWVADYGPIDHSHRRNGGIILPTAQGILFNCPVCYQHPEDRRAHSVLVWFSGRGVPDDAEPGAAYAPGMKPEYPAGRGAQRWGASGTSFMDLTLAPSIDLTRGSIRNCWHGFIQNGQIVGGV